MLPSHQAAQAAQMNGVGVNVKGGLSHGNEKVSGEKKQETI